MNKHIIHMGIRMQVSRIVAAPRDCISGITNGRRVTDTITVAHTHAYSLATNVHAAHYDGQARHACKCTTAHRPPARVPMYIISAFDRIALFSPKLKSQII